MPSGTRMRPPSITLPSQPAREVLPERDAHAVPLEREEVRDRGRDVDGGDGADRAGDAVRGDRDVVGVGVVGDPATLEQAAGLLQVGRGDVDRAALERLAEAVAQVAVLARRDRGAGRRGDAAQGGDVLGRDRVLEPQQAEGLELVCEALGVGDLVAPVAVEGDVDLGRRPRRSRRRRARPSRRTSARLSVPEAVSCMYGRRDVEVELQRAEAELGDDLARALGVELGREQLVGRRARVGAAVLGRADRAGLHRLGRLLAPARAGARPSSRPSTRAPRPRGSRRTCARSRGSGRRAGCGSARRRPGPRGPRARPPCRRSRCRRCRPASPRPRRPSAACSTAGRRRGDPRRRAAARGRARSRSGRARCSTRPSPDSPSASVSMRTKVQS